MSYYNATPASWRRQRIKFLMTGSKNGAWGAEAGESDKDATCLRVADFDWGRLQLNETERTVRSFQREQFERLQLQPGDLLLEKSGGGEKTPVGRIVAYSDEGQAVTSNFVARVRPSENVEGGFLLYILASQYMNGFSHQFIKQNTGIQNLDDSAWFSSDVFIPDQTTQREIVWFLDREIARIDDLIDRKRRMVEALNEKQEAFVLNAISGKIGPGQGYPFSREMQLKHFLRLNYGSALPAETRVVGAVEVYGSNGPFDSHDCPNTHEPVIIVGRKGSHGKVNWSDKAVHCTDTAYFVDPRHCSGDLRFAFYALQGLNLDDISRDTGVPGLDRSDAHRRKLKIPTIEGQKEIATFLDENLGKFSDLISSLSESIEKLREYRSSLITSAVTGQIDVAAWKQGSANSGFPHHELEKAFA